MENNVKHNEPKSSKTIKNSTNDQSGDENHADKSKNLPCGNILKANRIHYRQTTLSDYFRKQVFEKPRDEESKSADVMVDFRKLVSQLLNAKVLVERLPQPAIKAKPRPTLRINIERMQLDPHQQQKSHQPLKAVETNKSTLRYCHKCKTSTVDYKRTTVRRKCHKCGTDLLFVCDKCNSNLYQRHEHMDRHRKSCDGRKKSNGQELTSIKFYHCADCEFFTAYDASMKLHVSRTQHKALECK